MILLENYLEDTMDAVELEQYPGNMALSAMKKNPLSVVIAHENDRYFIASSDIETYMEAVHEIDVVNALNTIAEANKIDINKISVVVDEACDFVLEGLYESNIVLEKAAEADSMGLKQAMKWYGKVISKSTKVGDDTTREMIQERISVLKNCVDSMEKAKDDAQKGITKGRVKYALKGIIPFNSLFRLIKKQDVYAGIGLFKLVPLIISLTVVEKMIDREYESEEKTKVTDFDEDLNRTHKIARLYRFRNKLENKGFPSIMGADVVMRFATYTKMLDSQIGKTKEAIEFLEEKLKEKKEK